MSTAAPYALVVSEALGERAILSTVGHAAIVSGVAKRAVGVEVTKGVTAEQQFVKLMYDGLVGIMGGNQTEGLAGAERGEALTVCAAIWQRG